jgi:hypothetical protein
MKHLFILISILLLSFPVIGQSKETCYVSVEGSKEFNLNLFSQISKSLISQYFKPIKNIPPGGIRSDSCVYEITVTKEGDTTFVVFSGEDLNSYGDSKLYGSDGFQQSLLKSLYRSLEDKRKKICEDYGELLKKCGGVVQQDEPKKSVSAPAKISKKVIPVTPKVVKVPKTPTKKSITPTTSTSGGNRDVVIDRTNGLMWQKKPDGIERNWKDAELYCQKLSLGGYSDWRLPNESVLMKMIKNKMMFSSSLRNNYYWSSTVSNPTSWATYVNFGYGDKGGAWKGSGMYVRCVRGGN